jgi:uncharacterized membrane protein YfcA
MSLPSILFLLLIGAASGFLAGFFGVGGGIILVPMLLLFYSATGVTSLVATHLAFGTSLLVIVFASGSSAYEYHRNNQVLWRAVGVIGLASVVGASLGSVVAGGLQGKTLQQIFAVVVVVTAVRLFAELHKPKGSEGPKLGIPGLVGTGLVAGLVSSLAGVGGGVITIPLLYSLLHFPLKRAFGTSSATIVVTALAGVAGYVFQGWGNLLLPGGTAGYVDYLRAIPVIVSTVPLAIVGARLSEKTHPATLRQIFAAFLLVVAIKLFFF